MNTFDDAVFRARVLKEVRQVKRDVSRQYIDHREKGAQLARIENDLLRIVAMLERRDHPLGSVDVVRPADPDTGSYRRFTDADVVQIEQQLRELS